VREGVFMKSHSKSNSSRTSPIDSEVIFSILGNPTKRNIIFFLGERGVASFTEMRKTLKISVGNLYYNLDGLKNFVTKDEKRRYMLTEEGRMLYEILKEETSRINHVTQPKSTIYVVFNRVFKPILLPEGLFISIYGNKIASIIILLGVFALASLSAIYGKIDLFLLECSEHPLTSRRVIIQGVELPVELWLTLRILLSWVLITLILEGLCQVTGLRRFKPEFFVATLIALVPILIYPLIYHVLSPESSPLGGDLYLFLLILFRFLQVVTLGFLTAALTIFKGMSKERAFIIVFVLFYLSYLVKVLFW